ncbi:MAG: ASKHA domain-containing protein [Dehalococcoidia bacterium]|jgi:uncharacterized 2Fe-2S/4Fe-4S cluster protein (DUF4445 family)
MPEEAKPQPLRVAIDGLDLEVQVAARTSLLDALRSAGIAVDSECGGRGTCGECRVRFFEGAPPPTVEDAALLSPDDLAAGWRLACLTFLAADCRVAIPQRVARARRARIRILTEAAAPAARAEGQRRTGYGIAVDVGTTTVVCYLMDLARALQLGVDSFANPQSAFGPDVVARIAYAHRGPPELRELQRRLVSHLEKSFASLCRSAGVPPDAVSIVAAAGNMTMMHLLRGVDPWPLGVAPYEPVFMQLPPFPAGEIGFKRFARCDLQVLPGVGGHVGSDIVAGVLGLDLARQPGLSLFIDLGTNGEVVLASKRILAGASCAAGPAFEGVHISSGMPALPGAIERVDDEDGRLQLETIDSLRPAGLCGSGLIDAVALLLRRGLILPSGRFLAPSKAPDMIPDDLLHRLREDGGERRFLLVEGNGDIAITQQDIREVQLAKAAVRATIDLLLRESDLQAEAIDAVFVAGGFGSSLRSESILALGIVPEGVRGRIHAAGNTAGLGAKLALVYPGRMREAHRLARRMRHVELVSREDFRQAFAESMTFPAPA